MQVAPAINTSSQTMQDVLKEPDKVTTWSGRIIKGVLYTNSIIAGGIAGYMGITGGLDLKDDKTSTGFTGDRILVAAGAAFIGISSFGMAFFSNRWIATKKEEENVHELGEVVAEEEKIIDIDMQEKLNELETLISDLKGQLATSEAVKKKLNETLQDKLTELGVVSQNLKSTTQELIKVNTTAAELKKLNKRLGATAEELCITIDNEKMQNQRLQKEINTLRAQVGLLGKQAGKLSDTSNSIGRETGALGKKASELQNQLSTLTTQYQESQNKVAALEAKVKELGEVENKLAIAAKELKEGEQREQELTKNIEVITSQLKGLTGLEEKLAPLLAVLEGQSTSK